MKREDVEAIVDHAAWPPVNVSLAERLLALDRAARAVVEHLAVEYGGGMIQMDEKTVTVPHETWNTLMRVARGVGGPVADLRALLLDGEGE